MQPSLSILVLGLLAPIATAQSIRYVHAGALPGGDGTTWKRAYADLQDALQEATGNPGTVDEVWVARGVYRPDSGTGNRGMTFLLGSGLVVLGGFAGGESSADDSDPHLNRTVLSGDLLGDDLPHLGNRDDNTFHLVTATNLAAPPLLSGLELRGGNAVGAPIDSGYGPAIRVISSGLSIDNCWIEENGGAAIVARSATSIAIHDTTFRVNRGPWGGALHVDVASEGVEISGCLFEGNRATGSDGGAVFVREADLTVQSTVFLGNRAKDYGGALHLAYPFANFKATLKNCTFEGNRADWRGGSVGAILTTGRLVLRKCSIENSTAQEGGGVFVLGSSSEYALVKVRDTVLRGNSASLRGGGALLDDVDSDWARSSAILNVGLHTGGIRVQQGEVARFDGCRFLLNRSDEGGGGLRSSAETTRVVDCVVAGNSSSRNGAGLQFASTAVKGRVENCTVVFNLTAVEDTGGFWTAGLQTNAVKNSILWGNVGAAGKGLLAQVGGKVACDSCCVMGWDGSLPGERTFGLDPLLLDREGPDGVRGTEDDDFRLAAGSPCIDRGNDSLLPKDVLDLDQDGDTDEVLPVDVDGLPRETDDPTVPDHGHGESPVVDIGAHERQ